MKRGIDSWKWEGTYSKGIRERFFGWWRIKNWWENGEISLNMV
jgi:hypothetical protein